MQQSSSSCTCSVSLLGCASGKLARALGMRPTPRNYLRSRAFAAQPTTDTLKAADTDWALRIHWTVGRDSLLGTHSEADSNSIPGIRSEVDSNSILGILGIRWAAGSSWILGTRPDAGSGWVALGTRSEVDTDSVLETG